MFDYNSDIFVEIGCIQIYYSASKLKNTHIFEDYFNMKNYCNKKRHTLFFGIHKIDTLLKHDGHASVFLTSFDMKIFNNSNLLKNKLELLKNIIVDSEDKKENIKKSGYDNNIIVIDESIVKILANVIQQYDLIVNKTIVIIPCAGLCNRLRFLMSYYTWAKNENKKIIVIWFVKDDCNGYFTDHFHIDNNNVEIIENRNNISKKIVYNNEIININDVFYPLYKGFFWHPLYSPYSTSIYDDLKLNLSIYEKIQAKVKMLHPYISVHIRRTDHIKLAEKNNQFTEDDEFIKFINKYDKYNLYLATDNLETQQKFYDLFNEKIKFITLIDKNNNNLRKTSLYDAIFDMYMCINSYKFMGSGFSSFTEYIIHQREKNNIIHA